MTASRSRVQGCKVHMRRLLCNLTSSQLYPANRTGVGSANGGAAPERRRMTGLSAVAVAALRRARPAGSPHCRSMKGSEVGRVAGLRHSLGRPATVQQPAERAAKTDYLLSGFCAGWKATKATLWIMSGGRGRQRRQGRGRVCARVRPARAAVPGAIATLVPDAPSH